MYLQISLSVKFRAFFITLAQWSEELSAPIIPNLPQPVRAALQTFIPTEGKRVLAFDARGVKLIAVVRL